MFRKLKTAFWHPIGGCLGKDGAISTQSGTNCEQQHTLAPDQVLFSMPSYSPLAEFVRGKRKQLGLTQLSLAQNAGVGWRFVKELEAGKPTLRIDKVNQVLALFGYEVGAVPAIRPAEDEIR
jgi:y4mF family transcriptional regulator